MLPEKIGESLNCFGILFDGKDTSCRRCGLQEACQVKASNHGLGTITLSRNLIRQQRIPVIQAKLTDSEESAPDEPPIMCVRDEDLHNHLCSRYKRTKYKDVGWGFSFRDMPSDQASPFIVLDYNGKFRFCKPSRNIKNDLTVYKNAAYLPDSCDLDEAMDLINRHAEQAMTAEVEE